MPREIWKLYQEGEINEKIQDWAELWEDICLNADNEIFGLKLGSPHLTLLDLINEIEYGKFNYSPYFIEKIGYQLNNNITIKSYFKTDFQLINIALEEKNVDYLSVICKPITASFQSGKYYFDSCDLLRSFLLNDETSDKMNTSIAGLTEEIITELLILGLNIKAIRDFPRNVFDKYRYSEDGKILMTNFPVSSTKDMIEDDEEAYDTAIINEIDSLSISDRLERLKSYYSINSKEGIFLFEVEGLKGNIDINIGPVNFYSPLLKQYITEDYPFKEGAVNSELFSHQADVLFINAAINIVYTEPYSGKYKAVEEIERALDVLRMYIMNECPFEINSSYFHIVEKGRPIYTSISIGNSRVYKELKSYNLKSFDLEDNERRSFFNDSIKYLFDEDVKKIPFENKIIHSMRWFRKGFESNTMEEKLLNYWIVIENLAVYNTFFSQDPSNQPKRTNKLDQIKDIIAPFEAIDFTTELSIELYELLRQYLNSSVNSEPLLKLPKEIVNECMLDPQNGEEIDMEIFIGALPRLINSIDQKNIKKIASYTQKFYNDIDFAKSEISNKIKQVNQNVTLLYRYRNFIVHNAHYDRKILPFYYRKAEQYASNLLKEILYQHSIDNLRDHKDILLTKRMKLDKIMIRLKNKEKVNFFDDTK